jgi:hypothetical protein
MDGVRRYQDAAVPDVCVFRESIGLDGTYSLLSAKRLHIGKRCKIVVPKEIKVPEDAQGDDAAANNYKFSSVFGSAQTHKIQDVAGITGKHQAIHRCAGVLDMVAYIVNWQPMHPFYYHQRDFKTWQESEDTTFNRIQEKLNFDDFDSFGELRDPAPVPVHIDHRYGDVDYFERESFLIFHDDGSVQIGAGDGTHIVMARGSINIQAPDRISMEAGTDVVTLSNQLVMRAKRSIDLSASQHDVRIKAAKNMHFLAGNSGSGGMLLESKSIGSAQNYTGLVGEDVQSSGIVFLAKESTVAALASQVYLRTGGPGLTAGNITLDAGRGNNTVSIYAHDINTYSTGPVTFSFGPIDERSEVCEVYRFGYDYCLIDVPMDLGGQLRCYRGGGIYTQGDIVSLGCIVSACKIGTPAGGSLGIIASSYFMPITAAMNGLQDQAALLISTAASWHRTEIVSVYYQQYQIGNSCAVADMGFSFRDPLVPGAQYSTTQFVWAEPRWQMMIRFGLATGGVTWIEDGVEYQSRETYPWPGRVQWQVNQNYQQLDSLTMFDAAEGQDSDRPGTYETATLSPLDAVVMEGNYKLVR